MIHSASEEIASMHQQVDGWTRVFPWSRSKKSGCVETVYSKADKTVRIILPANVACNSEACLFEIRSVLKRRQDFQHRRRGRKPRPSKRVREAAKAARLQEGYAADGLGTGTTAADASRETGRQP